MPDHGLLRRFENAAKVAKGPRVNEDVSGTPEVDGEPWGYNHKEKGRLTHGMNDGCECR